MIGCMSERRADLFIDPDVDPREGGPPLGDEKATLAEFLRCQRLTLELKCAGLDAEQLARRSVEPSTMSLLGLVRHMAEVERGWFRRRMAGARRAQALPDRGGPGRRLRRRGRRPGRRRGGAGARGARRSPSPRRTSSDATDLGTVAAPRTASRSRCARCSCTWSRSTPGTTATPTCSASASTAAIGQ